VRLNRQQRRARGFRGPLPRSERKEPRTDGNPADMTGVSFYAWRVGWATAHINPDKCVRAFMESPAQWGVVPMRKTTRRSLKRRALQLCIDCAQRFVEARLQAQYAATQRREKLADRGTTTYAEQDAKAVVAGRRTR
jgi:hypothetical protein